MFACFGYGQTQKHSAKGKGSPAVKRAVAKSYVMSAPPPAIPVAKDTMPVIKQDVINPDFKGPYGEQIYTASDGRLYFIDKNDERVYINLEK